MMETGTRAPVIAIEGNIGAGKSTLARYIRRHYPSCHVVDEAESALMSAYTLSPERWGLSVQLDLLVQRATALRLAHARAHLNDGPIVLDRSIVGDRAFARANWQIGRLSAIEYRIWEDAHEELLAHTRRPDIVIYLDTPPELAHQRAEDRDARTHDLAYFNELARAHDDALSYVRSYGVHVVREPWGDVDAHLYDSTADRLLSRVAKLFHDTIIEDS